MNRSGIVIVLALAIVSCKPRNLNNSSVKAAGGGGSGDCSWADFKEPKTLEEAKQEVAKELFLLASTASNTNSDPVKTRAKLLLAARSHGVPAEKFIADCSCTTDAAKEETFVKKEADSLRITSKLADRVKEVGKFSNEAVPEAMVSIGQLAVRLGAEQQSELALTVTNELFKVSEASSNKISVADALTAGLALEITEVAESGSAAETGAIVDYAKQMFSAQDVGSSAYFKDISRNSKTKSSLTEFTKAVPVKNIDAVRILANKGKIFEEIGKIHSTFRTPEQSTRLMEIARRAPRVARIR